MRHLLFPYKKSEKKKIKSNCEGKGTNVRTTDEEHLTATGALHLSYRSGGWRQHHGKRHASLSPAVQRMLLPCGQDGEEQELPA